MFDINQPNVINIFTDGSIYNNNETKETLGSAGAILTINRNVPYVYDSEYTILRNTTNNETEIFAIFLGINLIVKHGLHLEDVKINLFSDSNISIQGLKTWIFKWSNNIRNDVMYGSSGKPVANQDIFNTIVNTIVNNNININLYHIKGHVDNIFQKKNAIKVFKNKNKIDIDMDTLNTLTYFNNIVDDTSRNLLKFYKGERYNQDIKSPFRISINGVDMDKYKQLIKGGIHDKNI